MTDTTVNQEATEVESESTVQRIERLLLDKGFTTEYRDVLAEVMADAGETLACYRSKNGIGNPTKVDIRMIRAAMPIIKRPRLLAKCVLLERLLQHGKSCTNHSFTKSNGKLGRRVDEVCKSWLNESDKDVDVIADAMNIG